MLDLLQKYSVKEVLALNNAVIVDVRTREEYADDHIPGSINCPVLDGDQRKEVGTVYKTISKQQALFLGAKYICANIPQILDQIGPFSKGEKIAFYCFRGGLRSKSIATVVSCMHVAASFLEGGYKRYRNHVLEYLATTHLEKMIGLYGYTGSGKTEIINNIKQFQVQVLDLEGRANHKGSVFGGLNCEAQPAQRLFESLLADDIRGLNPKLPILIEGESSKIGRLHLPVSIYKQMLQSPKIFVDVPLAVRIENILHDYQAIDAVQFFTALESVRRYMKKALYDEIHLSFGQGDLSKTVELLLLHYYDQLYLGSNQTYDYVLPQTSSREQLQLDVVDIMRSQMGAPAAQFT